MKIEKEGPQFFFTALIVERSQSKTVENWRNFLKKRKHILETPGMIPKEYIYLAYSRGRSFPFQDLCSADQLQIEGMEYAIEMEEAMHPSVTPVATKRAGNKRQSSKKPAKSQTSPEAGNDQLGSGFRSRFKPPAFTESLGSNQEKWKKEKLWTSLLKLQL